VSGSRVLIVGAGVAGMSAALWLHDLEHPFEWWTADDDVGGTLRRVGNPIGTLLGLDTEHGGSLVDRFAAHVRRYDLWPTTRRPVERLTRADGHWLATDDDVVQRFEAVLLATGTRPRRLGLDGEKDLLGRGVERSVTRTRDRYRDARCVIVGGGDAALEGALLLTEVTDRITIVHRSAAFRGQARFVDRVLDHPSIDVRFDTTVNALVRASSGALTGVRLSTGDVLDADGLFVRIGVEPSIPDVDGGVERDARGYLAVDRAGRTNRDALYAAGDVTGAAHQSVSAAQGDAARAVAAIVEDVLSRR